VCQKGLFSSSKPEAERGYGNPHLRDPARVAEEVKNGIISIKKAKEDYGVVINPKTFEVNSEETEKLRKKKKS